MSYAFSLPFHAFRLKFPNRHGDQVLRPVADSSSVSVGESKHVLMERFAGAFQKEVLDKGRAGELLDMSLYPELQQTTVTTSFASASDRVSYPAFEMELDAFYGSRNGTWWGIIPSLGVEAAADGEEQLMQNLAENVRVYFVRTGRLRAVQGIVSALWYEEVSLQSSTISLQALAPSELESQEKKAARQLLSDAATPMQVVRKELFGMEHELEQVLRAFQNNFGRCVLLVGPGGCGKSAIVAEASRQWKIKHRSGIFWETTASRLIKELTRDTGWQYNLSHLCRELNANGDWLYVRSLMELFEVGRYAGNEVSIGEFLRNYLSRGEIALIAECTQEELQRIELISPNFASFFSKVEVIPPKEKVLEDIVQNSVVQLAAERKINFDQAAVREAIALHARFNPYSGMPGKVIRFLESVIREPLRAGGKTAQRHITGKDIVLRFCEESGIPPLLLDDDVPLDPVHMLDRFNNNVFGQPHAAVAITDLLVKMKTRTSRERKPIASILFAGPTGVGKTELAKVLAEVVFGERHRMIRFDMSEYSGPDAVFRLTGAGDVDGLLTAAVRREPFCVLLFDEIEKASPDFYDLLLQILDEGRLSDNSGKLVNFCSAIIIMTSNIGASGLRSRPIGLKPGRSSANLREHYQDAVKKYFRPELINRFDEIIPFNALDEAAIRFVVDRELKLLLQREGIRYRRMNLHIDEKVADYLGRRGFDPQYGARYLQRAMREMLLLPLSKSLAEQDPTDHLEVFVQMDAQGYRPVANVTSDPLSLELLIEELHHANITNHSSNLRRNIYALEDGFMYRELLSSWSLLEDMRINSGTQFWKNHKSVHAYNALSRFIERMNALKSEIETLETNASVSFLGQTSDDVNLPTQLSDWTSAAGIFKKDLVSYSKPEFKSFQLGIFGPQLEHIFTFYHRLLGRLGLHIAAVKAVWHRASYYEELVTDPENAEAKVKREAYLYTNEDWFLDNSVVFRQPKPEKSGDKLVGLECKVEGPLAYVLMMGENGFQHWMHQGQTEFSPYLAQVVLDDEYSTPKRVHRLDFFTPKPRRIISPGNYTDKVYDIAVTVEGELMAGIVQFCEDQMLREVDSAVG